MDVGLESELKILVFVRKMVIESEMKSESSDVSISSNDQE